MIRQAIVTRLSEGLGRPVALGDIRGDLIHGFELRDLVIAERGGFSRGVLFSADRIRFALDLPQLFLHPGNVLRSLGQVDVYAPRLVVARDDKGAWNLEDFFTPQRTPLGPEYRGRIVVHGGIIAYADMLGLGGTTFVTRFAKINGTIDYRQGRQVGVGFSGRSADGEDAAVRGRYLPDTGVFDLDVTAQNGVVGHWGGYLVRLNQLRWVAGRFDARVHLLGTPSGVDLAVDYQGTLHLRDAAAEYLPTHLSLRHVTGTLALNTDNASTEDLTLTANGSRLGVRGDIAYPAGGWLDLAITSPGVDLSMIRALFFPAAHLGLAGQASGSVWITGPAGKPYLDGDITSASGRLNREAFDALRTRFQYAAGTLALSELSTEMSGGRVAGNAVLDLSGSTPSYLFAGAAENLDVRALPAAGLPVTDGLTGRVTGQVASAGSGGRVRLMAGVSIVGGSVHGQAFHDLRALFWDDDGAVDLSFLRAQIANTTLYASGRVAKSGALDLSVAAFDLPLSALSARAGLNGMSVVGSADFDGRLRGTSAAPGLSGTVTAWDGQIGPVPFAFVKGDVRVTPKEIASRSLSLVDGAATYQMSGGLRFNPLSAVNLRLDAEHVPAASVLHGTGNPSAVTGTLAAHVAVDGPLAHPRGTGRVTLEGGTVAGQRVDHVEANLAGDGRRIQIRSLDAQRNASRLHITGAIDLQGSLDLSVSANQIRLSELSAAIGLDPAPQGVLELMGTVHGTLKSPEVSGSLRVPDLALGGQAFGAAGTFTYRAGRLHVDPLALTQGTAQYRLTGDLFLGAHPSADLAFDVQNGQVATILRASRISLPALAEGTINGKIQITGPLADPSAHLSLALSDAKVGGMSMGTGVADLTLSHGAIDIQRLELTPGQGHIAAQGQVVINGTSNVEVAAYALDPNLLRPFFNLGTPLAGKMDFTMQWSGPTRNPTAGLSLEATDAGFPGVTADRIVGLAYYKSGTIHIENGTIAKGQHQVVIQGDLPVAPSGLALAPDQPLSLDVHLENADLSLLSLFTRSVHDASGTIEGQVAVRGTVRNPAMTGMVQSHGGRIRIDPVQTPLEDMNVEIAFSQNQLLVQRLSAAVGGGEVQGSGTVGITNFHPDRVALDLTARGATVSIPGFYSGGVDADLSLSGGAERPLLRGNIALSHGRVEVGGEFGPAASNELPAVPLDVAITPTGDVWFDTGPIRAELGGAVHVGGTARQPQLSGTVQALQGTIVLLGTPFDLTEGQAVFSEALGFEPAVSARAQALYGTTRVFMEVNGVLPNATIAWSSEPPLSESDIVGLVMGRTQPSGAVGQELGRLLFGSVSTAIRRAFRLDELSISYDAQSPVTLRIGKFLVRNLYLAVSEVFGHPAGTAAPATGPVVLTRLTTNGQADTVLSLEYILSPTVFLTYDVDTLGNNGFFLLGRFPF
jgi:translocation and assembly module TamB